MKVNHLIVIILGLFVASASFASLRAQTPGSVWGGVYTEEQAKRGAAGYSQQCGACHGPDLTGGESAPALAGDTFLSNWNGLTVGDLFERIRISMPQNAPGSLSRQENADILAFMLSVNKYPAGKTELGGATDPLKQIKIDPKS
jgi:cytochrome c